jgi:hypothetical protein
LGDDRDQENEDNQKGEPMTTAPRTESNISNQKRRSNLMKRKRIITIMSDRDCRYYLIPKEKEAKFQAWEASVIGGENDEMGCENFLDYKLDGPLATLMLMSGHRRRERARLRDIRNARLRRLRDIRDVRDVRDN